MPAVTIDEVQKWYRVYQAVEKAAVLFGQLARGERLSPEDAVKYNTGIEDVPQVGIEMLALFLKTLLEEGD